MNPSRLPQDPRRRPEDRTRWIAHAWTSRWLPVWIAVIILGLLGLGAVSWYFGFRWDHPARPYSGPPTHHSVR